MHAGPGVCILRWLQAGAHRRSHLGLAGSWWRSPGLELRAMALMPVPAWGGVISQVRVVQRARGKHI